MSGNDVLSSDPRAPPRSFARSLEVMPKYGRAFEVGGAAGKPRHGLLCRQQWKIPRIYLVISVAARFAVDCKLLKVVGADRFHGKLSRQIAV
jgi:hypothetical protein